MKIQSDGTENFGHEEEYNSWQQPIKVQQGVMKKGYCCLTVEENKELKEIQSL
jgi:hypothetical protein